MPVQTHHSLYREHQESTHKLESEKPKSKHGDLCTQRHSSTAEFHPGSNLLLLQQDRKLHVQQQPEQHHWQLCHTYYEAQWKHPWYQRNHSPFSSRHAWAWPHSQVCICQRYRTLRTSVTVQERRRPSWKRAGTDTYAEWAEARHNQPWRTEYRQLRGKRIGTNTSASFETVNTINSTEK